MSGIIPDAYPDYPGNPATDVPEWDERHDGYAVEGGRTAIVTTRSGKSVLVFTAAEAGLKIEPVLQTKVTLTHGNIGTLEVLEALHDVVLESLKRERALQDSRRERERGPRPD